MRYVTGSLNVFTFYIYFQYLRKIVVNKQLTVFTLYIMGFHNTKY